MKVVLINKSECTGGAAVAANRLFSSLKKRHYAAEFLVQDAGGIVDGAISVVRGGFSRRRAFLRFVFERLFFLPYEKNKKVRFDFSPANTGYPIYKHHLVKASDLLHLHWINQGFISIKGLKRLAALQKPMVWTLHDMWPFTGGCHHSWGCDNYFKACGNCKFLKKPGCNDLSARVWQQKAWLRDLKQLEVVVVSNWLKERAMGSSLMGNLNITVIPNSIDTGYYSPVERSHARKAMNFRQDKTYVLFGANRIDDEIKGIGYLKQALALLKTEEKKRMVLVLFGNPPKFAPDLPGQFDVEVVYLGVIGETIKPNLFSACDMAVVPSLYETFGQIATEALACETAVVAFNNSGITDIVDHKENGYLADYKSANDFSQGIRWVLENNTNNYLGKAGRQKILREFCEEVVTQKYVALYKKMCNE